MVKKILQPWNLVWAILLLLGVLVLWMPTGAFGAVANKPTAGADQARSYGSWGSPSTGTAGGVSFAPFNSKHPEMVSAACVVDGRVLNDNQIRVLSEIAKMSLLVSRGQIDAERWGGKDEEAEEVTEGNKDLNELWSSAKAGEEIKTYWSLPNYGFDTGSSGVQKFVRMEKRWLEKPLKDLPGTSDTIDNYAGEFLQNSSGTGRNLIDTVFGGVDRALDVVPTPVKIGTGLSGVEGGAKVLNGLSGVQNSLVQNSIRGVQDPRVLSSLSAWSNYKNRQFRTSGSAIRVNMDNGEHRKKESLEEIMEGFPLNLAESRQAASYLNSNATRPVDIFTDKFPDGCITAIFNNNLDVSFSTLFENPSEFLTGVTLGALMAPINGLYENLSHDAWSGLFHTAHTERGDLVWGLDDKCLNKQENSRGMFTTTRYGETCTSNNTPLGFNKRNLQDVQPKERPFFLNLAALIAWLITGTYFVVLFASAVVFIYRGNRTQNMNLMKIAPRILLSMLLAISATFLIGAAISTSNWITMAIMDIGRDSGPSIGTLNVMLGAAGDMMNIEGEFANALITLIVACIALVSSLVFLFGVVIKQIILIFLIVSAPVAIFCLIVESWRPMFMRWLKTFAIILFIPIGIALTLQVGILANPILGSNVSDTMSGIMIVVTLFAMAWIMKTGLHIAVRGSSGTWMQGGGKLLQRVGGRVPLLGRPLGALGGGMQMMGQGLQSRSIGDKVAGSLVPGGRAAGGGISGPGIASRAAGSLKEGWQERGQKRDQLRQKRYEKHELRKGNRPEEEAKKGFFGKRILRMQRKRDIRKSESGANAYMASQKGQIGWRKGAGLKDQLTSNTRALWRKGFKGGYSDDKLKHIQHPDPSGRMVPALDKGGKPILEKDGAVKMVPAMVAVTGADAVAATIYDRRYGEDLHSKVNSLDAKIKDEVARGEGFSGGSREMTLKAKSGDKKARAALEKARVRSDQAIFDRYQVLNGAQGVAKGPGGNYIVTTTKQHKAAENAKPNGRFGATGMSEEARKSHEEQQIRRASETGRYDDLDSLDLHKGDRGQLT